MSPGQARQGQVFKRCTRCNMRVPERRCPKCGARDSFTWAYVVDITPKDAQGRLIGKRRQRKAQGFATRAAAQDALNELQVEKKAGTHVDPSRMTLGEYLDSWVQRGCGGVRPTTLKGWESAIRNHVQPRIGLLPLQQVSRTDFELLYADLQANGYAKGPSPAQLEVYAGLARRWKAMTEGGTTPTIAALARDLERSEATVRYWIRRCHELGMLGGKPAPIKVGRGLSLKSVWNVHVCLRAALYDAMATDPPLLRKNPAAGAMREPDAQHEMVTFTREELDTFLEVSRGEREFALWWTIACSGMRRGEALGLRWSDVKWNLNTLSVQQQLGLDDDDDGERDFAPPKTRHGRRPIGVDVDTMHVLHEHRAAQEFERQSWGPEVPIRTRPGVRPAGRQPRGSRQHHAPLRARRGTSRPEEHPGPARTTSHVRHPLARGGRRHQRGLEAARSPQHRVHGQDLRPRHRAAPAGGRR